MCGRYASTRNPATLAAEFAAIDATGSGTSEADYNIAPTKDVFSVVQRHPRAPGGQRDHTRVERSVRVMRWGLVPHWSKDPSAGSRMINARAETVTDKPAFRTAIRYHRCLLPADGWFEWQTGTGPKQPYFMTRPDSEVLALAGIWATWHDPSARENTPPLVTCSVLTTEAVGELTTVHPRMPLVLPGRTWDQWLDPDLVEVTDLLAPSAEVVEELELRPVSSAVNNVANNRAELVERMAEDRTGTPPLPVGLDRANGEPG
ncbi:SOS response-associated peptidase [Parasphingorhabdus pacifica]